jgi:hypothetical protein
MTLAQFLVGRRGKRRRSYNSLMVCLFVKQLLSTKCILVTLFGTKPFCNSCYWNSYGQISDDSVGYHGPTWRTRQILTGKVYYWVNKPTFFPFFPFSFSRSFIHAPLLTSQKESIRWLREIWDSVTMKNTVFCVPVQTGRSLSKFPQGSLWLRLNGEILQRI